MMLPTVAIQLEQEPLRQIQVIDRKEYFRAVNDLSRNPVALYMCNQVDGFRSQVLRILSEVTQILSGQRRNPVTFPWWELDYSHLLLVRTALHRRVGFNTVNTRLCVLRGVLKQCWRLGLMSADNYYRAKSIENLRGVALPKGRFVEPEELKGIFEVCAADKGVTGIRDAALFATFYATGLRSSEIVKMNIGDYNRHSGEIIVRHGKYNRARALFIANEAKMALNTYLDLRGGEDGALFWPSHRSNRFLPRPLGKTSIHHILRKRVFQGGVRYFSAYDMRRSFVSILIEMGVDLFTVKELAGHSLVQTTARYDRRGEYRKQRACQLIRIPYRPSAS